MTDHQPMVLLVDDDLPLLRGLDRLLRARGFQTVSTGDPDRARELMDLVPIDAVVTDLGLPMRDGRCFAERSLLLGKVGGASISSVLHLLQRSTWHRGIV